MRLNIVKYSLLFFGILFFTACTNNPVFKPQEHIVKTETKWIIDNLSEDKLTKISFKEFDRKGNLIFSEEFNEVGVLLQRKVISYSNNQIVENVMTFRKNQTESESKNIIYLDNKGNIKERISISDKGDTTEIIRFTYDINGKLAEEISFDNNGEVINRTSYLYNYNNDGFVTSRLITDGIDNNYFSRDSIIYRPDARQVERITYNSEGNKENIYTYIYDNAGNILKEIHTNQDGLIIKKYIYEYTYF